VHIIIQAGKQTLGRSVVLRDLPLDVGDTDARLEDVPEWLEQGDVLEILEMLISAIRKYRPLLDIKPQDFEQRQMFDSVVCCIPHLLHVAVSSNTPNQILPFRVKIVDSPSVVFDERNYKLLRSIWNARESKPKA
jgi:hypothetical protein